MKINYTEVLVKQQRMQSLRWRPWLSFYTNSLSLKIANIDQCTITLISTRSHRSPHDQIDHWTITLPSPRSHWSLHDHIDLCTITLNTHFELLTGPRCLCFPHTPWSGPRAVVKEEVQQLQRVNQHLFGGREYTAPLCCRSRVQPAVNITGIRAIIRTLAISKDDQ